MYETQDMSFAAYLVANGYRIASVKRSGRRVSWVFEISDSDLDSMESTWPSTPECRFFNTYQTLKNQIRKV
jgi:hypothetical protein